MRVVIQRVLSASVTVEGEVVSSIDRGYLLLVGVERGDQEEACRCYHTHTHALMIALERQ